MRYFLKYLSLTLFFTSIFFSLSYPLKAKASAEATSKIFVELSKKLVPSVVNIYTKQKVMVLNRDLNPMEQFFSQLNPFFDATPRVRNSLGSGFIIDAKKGLILTNHHVVADADSIAVVLSGENKERDSIAAKIIAVDSDSDIAILEIKTNKELKAAKFGSSENLQVGEIVLAIGNPFGLGSTVTQGIVSAKGRVFPMSQFANYIQTDTPINPGNSGGPLINLKGEVVGVNTFINATAQGIGFAIQSDYIKRVLPDLLKEGTVTRGYIGVQIGELTPDFAETLKLDPNTRGVIVASVQEGGSASKAGIKPYDVILEVDGVPISSTRQLIRAITIKRPGQRASLLIVRAGKKKQITVAIERRGSSHALSRRQKRNSHPTIRKRIGIAVENLGSQEASDRGLPAQTKGVVVRTVRSGSLMDRVGIIPGHVIVEIDRKPVSNVREFYKAIKKPKKYILKIYAGNRYILRTLDLSR